MGDPLVRELSHRRARILDRAQVGIDRVLGEKLTLGFGEVGERGVCEVDRYVAPQFRVKVSMIAAVDEKIAKFKDDKVVYWAPRPTKKTQDRRTRALENKKKRERLNGSQRTSNEETERSSRRRR